MAMAWTCDGCGGQADLTVTLLSRGDVLAFCVPCSAQWAEGHAEAVREAISGQAAEADTEAADNVPGDESGQDGGQVVAGDDAAELVAVPDTGEGV